VLFSWIIIGNSRGEAADDSPQSWLNEPYITYEGTQQIPRDAEAQRDQKPSSEKAKERKKERKDKAQEGAAARCTLTRHILAGLVTLKFRTNDHKITLRNLWINVFLLS